MERGTPENPTKNGVRGLVRRHWRKAAKLLGVVTLLGSVGLGTSALLAKRKCDRARAEIATTAKFFDRQGQKIRYDLKGEANAGPTVVLLSGFLGSLEQWHDVQQAIIEDAHAPVLTYDRGGYGLSDAPPTADAAGQADELADLAALKSLKPPLVVVGFSSSALIARAFAQRHPTLTGGLVFLDPTGPEQIVGGSYKDTYARRVVYERVPILTLTKRLIGLQSAIGQRGAVPTPTELRAGQILNFPSHWWAGYREGSVMEASAEQARVDWPKLHIPVTVVSVADPAGSARTKFIYGLHKALVEASGAELVHPDGFNHDQVHHDDAFVPYIVRAVTGVVTRTRAQAAAPKP